MFHEPGFQLSLLASSPIFATLSSSVQAARRRPGILIALLALLCLFAVMGVVLVLLAVLLWWLSRRSKDKVGPVIEAEPAIPAAEEPAPQAPVSVAETPTTQPEPSVPQAAPETSIPIKQVPAAEQAIPEPPAAEPEPEPPTQDDLRRIRGIGPKIADLLQSAGITTYAQLAETETSRLQEILSEAGVARLADPTSWIEQARLAAEGDWEAFEALQDELKSGRRA